MKKYIVADGYCFTHAGIDYTAGQEIPADVFNPAAVLERFVAEGKLIAKGEEKAEKTKDEAKEAESVSQATPKVVLNKKRTSK